MGSSGSQRHFARLARDGDREAFGQLAEAQRVRLRALVTRWLGKRIRQSVSVDDVCQETFLRAFRGISSFVPRHPDSFFRWLASIARNVLHELDRRTASPT